MAATAESGGKVGRLPYRAGFAWVARLNRATCAGLVASAALLGLAWALWLVPATTVRPEALAPLGEPWLTWWGLAILVGACEVVVLHLQVRREAQGISLSEVGIVVGLFFAGPVAFVVGRAVGSMLVFVVHRRQAPVKVLFNTSLYVAESTLALLVFHLLAPESVFAPAGWLGAVAACAAVGALAAFTITLLIGAVEMLLSLREVASQVGQAALTSAVVAAPTLAAVHAIASTRWSVLPLLFLFLVALYGFRAYRDLSERHQTVSRLYRLTQVVGGTQQVNDVLRLVLEEGAEVLSAERVEIVLARPGDSEREPTALVQYTLGSGGTLLESHPSGRFVADPQWLSVLTDVRPFLAPRRSHDPAVRAFLLRHGLRDAICVPLKQDAAVIGTLLVGNRRGEVRSFDEQDAQLLETVANHCCIALENGYLLDRLRHDALHDHLTGLPNRAMLNQRLGDLAADVREGRSKGFSVVILDLVRFKDVNDTLGHQVGDQVLRETAFRLGRAVREGDLAARLGGDEFALLLTDVAGQAEATARGERLRELLAEPIELREVSIEVGASIGMSLAPAHGDTPRSLLTRADAAMYEAKTSGTGLAVYEPGLETTVSPQRLALAAQLRRGIESGELEVHVQPVAATHTGDVVGVEALVRWRHPVLGMLRPDDFIPLAERTGLIGDLTRVVLEQAVEACGRWRASGRDLNVAVNLSARSISDPGLAELIVTLLRKHRMPARCLTLEITESSIVGRPARALRVLDRLREAGVELALDDFGTGYSSLSYLRELPVQSIKIDKRFVSRLSEGGEDAAIVGSIVDLARSLNLRVVAEGVEDDATWARLDALGCAFVQGYQLARPMPLAKFPQWLATSSLRRRRIDLVRTEIPERQP